MIISLIYAILTLELLAKDVIQALIHGNESGIYLDIGVRIADSTSTLYTTDRTYLEVNNHFGEQVNINENKN